MICHDENPKAFYKVVSILFKIRNSIIWYVPKLNQQNTKIMQNTVKTILKKSNYFIVKLLYSRFISKIFNIKLIITIILSSFSISCAVKNDQFIKKDISKNNSNSESILAKNSSNFNQDIVIAKYIDGNITKKEVDSEIKILAMQNSQFKDVEFDKLDKDQKEAVINEIIIKKILYKKAKKLKLHNNKSYKDALNNFQNEMLKQEMIVHIVKEATSQDKIINSYNKLIKDLSNKKEVKISYIALSNSKDANAIYQLLIKSPAKFSFYAKNKSIDKETAKNGGDLDFVIESIVPSEIVEKVRIAGRGNITKPILVGGKYFIAILKAERDFKVPDLKDIENEIAKNLAKKAVEEFASESLKMAKLQIYSQSVVK